MPLTTEDIAYLKDQGIDPNSFQILSDEEAQDYETKQRGRLGAVGSTLRENAGALTGGGLAGLGGWTLGGAAALGVGLAPESFGASLLIPAVASALMSYAGSKAGGAVQHKVVEPLLGETPETQQEVAKRAESARRVYPYTTMATDITAGALAGGGSPSLRPPLYAAQGLVEGLRNAGLKNIPDIVRGASTSPVYNQAIQNVITGGALNTAIGAATQLATTGRIDPKELAGSAVGGTLFAQPSALGRAVNKNWTPIGRAQPERLSVVDSVDPSAENISKVQAYQKPATEAADAIEAQVQEGLVRNANWAQQQEDQQNALYVSHALAEAQRQKNAQQTENWIATDDKGSYVIPDKTIAIEFYKRYREDPKTADTPAEAAIMKARNEQLRKVSVADMRKRVYNDDLQRYNPDKYNQQQAAKAQEDAAQLEQMRELNRQLEEAKAKAATQQPTTEPTPQPTVQPEPIHQPATQEELKQQLASEIGQEEEPTQPQQPTPKQPDPQRVAQIQQLLSSAYGESALQHFEPVINEHGQTGLRAKYNIHDQPEGGGNIIFEKGQTLLHPDDPVYQTGGTKPQNETETNPAITTALRKEAGRANVGIGNIVGELRTPSGNLARGVSWDPNAIGRRLIGLAKNASNDTGYHEIVHVMLRDLRSSGDPNYRAIAEAVVKAHGGEEPAAQAIGQRYQQRAEYNPGILGRLRSYLADVMVATRTRGGLEGSAEDIGQNLIARMRQRHGVQDITQPPSPQRINRFTQDVPPPTYNEERPELNEDRLVPALKLKDGTNVKGEPGQNHGHVEYKAVKMGKDTEGAIQGFMRGDKFYTRDQAITRFGRGNTVDLDLYGDKYQPADKARYDELTEEMRQAIRSGDDERLQRSWKELEGIKNRNGGMPPTTEEGGTKYQEATDDTQPSYFKYTQAALEAIKRNIPDENGRRTSNALQKTIVEKQNLLGRLWNPIAKAAKRTTQEEQNRVRDTLLAEVNDKTSHRDELNTEEERNLYDTIRAKLLESAQYRQEIGEPVYRNGEPTKAQIDPYYYPTTTDPKVSETYRKNTDRAAIKRLNEEFIQHQLTHGYTREEAQQNLQTLVDSFQGSAQRGGDSNQNFFNADRKAQGIPLPETWQRQDLMRNLEAYHRRAAADISYYNNIERDHKVMAALGYSKDPWKNPINEPDVERIYGNPNVRAVMDQLRGEHAGYAERTTHAGETLATTLMLGPLTEIHKNFSTQAQVMTMADNPIQAAKTYLYAIQHIGDAWTKVLDTGYVQLDAAKARDMIDAHVAGFERLRGMAKLVRNIYTLGGLTDHFTKAFAHASGEYLIPAKVEMAANGDKNAQRLLQHLDPDYTVGKTYEGAEMTKMASEFANLIHGSKDARTLPNWMLHDNEISAFFKLSSWNIAQTNNFFRNVVTPLKRDGNIAPLLMTTLGVTLGGAVIKELRELMASKKSPIPSLQEIANSTEGFSSARNMGAAAYNWMAMASYAGFAGILSQVAKVPFDFAFKNAPGGATFPLDEEVTSVAKTARNVAEAIANDPQADIVKIGSQALFDIAKQNIQFMRIGINHLAQNNLLPGEMGKKEAYGKQLADKLAELRRFKMVEGMPFESQGEGEGNPYYGMETKKFKRETDVGAALKELQPIIRTIINRYGNNPDVMLQQLRSLKTMDYPTMPSMKDTPLAFGRYVRFLKNTQGEASAQTHVNDYLRREMINEVKGSIVP